MYSSIWFDACTGRCLDAFSKYQNNYESLRSGVRLCRGAGQPGSGGTKTNLSLFDEFTISIMCALCGAASHCYRPLLLASEILIRSHKNKTAHNSPPSKFRFIFPCSRCNFFIVALACFVRLTFQVQVYYHRWCNGCARASGVGSTNTNERPVSFVSG